MANFIQDALGTWLDVTSLNAGVFRDDVGLSYLGSNLTGAIIADDKGLQFASPFTNSHFQDDRGIWDGTNFQDDQGLWFTMTPSGAQIMWVRNKRRKR